MPEIAVIHLQSAFEPYTETVILHRTPFMLRHVACAGDLGAMVAHIAQYQHSDSIDAIALVGVSRQLQLGHEQVEHINASRLFLPKDTNTDTDTAEDASNQPETIPTPILDGSGILATMERWAVRLVHKSDPTLWAQKRVLMVPGLNHGGLAEALEPYTADIRYADPFIYFSLPTAPGVGSAETLPAAARRTLPQLREIAYQNLFPVADDIHDERGGRLFAWADVLAGDINLILRHAPRQLSHKTIVVPALSPDALAALQERQATRVITLLPPLSDKLGDLATHDPAVFEAVLTCLHANSAQAAEPLDETTYLNLLADVQWQPGLRQLDTSPEATLSFAFVLVPESSTELKQIFDWTSFLPDPMVERFAAYLLPHHLSHMTELSSPATSRTVNGLLFTLGVTPPELARRDPAFLQKRLVQAATLAERLGTRLLGLDGLPDVIFPAVDTAASQINLPLTTGRTLGLVATLNTAVSLQEELTPAEQRHILITAATTPLGQRTAEWLAQTGQPLTLLGHEPDQLIMLKQALEARDTASKISISTTAEPILRQASLLVVPEADPTLNWRLCAPGAVICDLVRPFAYAPDTWEVRPDLLVIHTTAVRLPGHPTLGYDFKLFDGAIPAELAEVILLALEHDEPTGFALGAVPTLDDMHHAAVLFKRHGFQLASARSYQQNVTPDVIGRRRTLAQSLRNDPAKLAAWRGTAPDSPEPQNQLQLDAKSSSRKHVLAATGLSAFFAALAAAVAWWWKKRDS